MDFNHSDYVIYGDETGDLSMHSLCREYPIFALALCVFSKQEYVIDVVRQVKGFKFAFWGHDMVVLHSQKIRKQIEEFYFLQNRNLREQFMDRLTKSIESSPFTLVATGVNKTAFQLEAVNLYDFCLQRCLAGIYQFLEEKDQMGRLTYLILESRMPEENRNLSRSLHRILDQNKHLQERHPLKLIFADKRVNSIGLQLADLVAYPIGRHILNPGEKNLAFDIVRKKFFQYPNYLNAGLQVFPEIRTVASEKQKTSDFSEV